MLNTSPPYPKLRVESLSKSFAVDGRREQVLDAVDLTVQPGEFISIIGPSGCGKSTLLNIVAGLDQPDAPGSDAGSGAGSVALDGDKEAPRLGQVGYMQQKDLLLPWRTVLDNAILGLEMRGVSRSKARSRALELTDAFGLTGFEGQYPFTLSGGMRQRAAFLRTMLMGQDLVLLDEPFGALDALTRVQMQEWLLELWDSMQSTIVLITHDVDEAVLVSDRVYVLTPRPGRVEMVLDVDLPRPRHYDMVTSPEFGVLKSRLMEPLRSQIQAARPAGMAQPAGDSALKT